MPSEGGRRGRRDNGLDAAAFVPLVDVDPRVGEHLLDVLASAGVPAFLEPSADVEPYTRAVSLPSPPTDRLWVDREQHRAAREIVDAETPHGTRPEPRAREDEPSRGLSDLDEERAWREIVSAWNEPAAAPPRPRSAPPGRTEPGAVEPPDAPADPAAAAGPTAPGGAAGTPGATGESDVQRPPGEPAEPAKPAGPGAADGSVPTGADLDRAAEERARAEQDAADEVWLDEPATPDEGHYEPPPPPPVPRPSRQAVLGVLMIALGILLLAAPGVVGLDERSGLTFGVLAVLGGGALLVLRLRQTRADDGPDDGAVV